MSMKRILGGRSLLSDSNCIRSKYWPIHPCCVCVCVCVHVGVGVCVWVCVCVGVGAGLVGGGRGCGVGVGGGGGFVACSRQATLGAGNLGGEM